MLDEWLKCQQGWVYLEPIFGSEDMLQQMPNEARKFRGVDAAWSRVMARAALCPELLSIAADEDLLKTLLDCNKLLDQVRPAPCPGNDFRKYWPEILVSERTGEVYEFSTFCTFVRYRYTHRVSMLIGL